MCTVVLWWKRIQWEWKVSLQWVRVWKGSRDDLQTDREGLFFYSSVKSKFHFRSAFTRFGRSLCPRRHPVMQLRSISFPRNKGAKRGIVPCFTKVGKILVFPGWRGGAMVSNNVRPHSSIHPFQANMKKEFELYSLPTNIHRSKCYYVAIVSVWGFFLKSPLHSYYSYHLKSKFKAVVVTSRARCLLVSLNQTCFKKWNML